MSLSLVGRINNKIKACGVCGTDLHIHEGEFIAEFPLIPGHETIGEVVGKFTEESQVTCL